MMRARVKGLFRRLSPRFKPPILDSRSAYALWSTSYPALAHNPLMEAEQAAMLSLLPPIAGAAVLDIACGSGRYGTIALSGGARLVIGVDNSLPMLQSATFPVLIGEMDALPLRPAFFDVCVCALALGHLPRPRMARALGEIARVLRPDGQALISDFHPFLALAGHQRSFKTASGHLYAVEHYVHLWSDYFTAAASAGFALDAVAEPHITGAPTPGPGVLVLRFQKRAH